MKELRYTHHFKKDLKHFLDQTKKLQELQAVLDKLHKEVPLEEKNRQHELKGVYEGCWECHIERDFLLIWQDADNALAILRLGSHSELFGD